MLLGQEELGSVGLASPMFLWAQSPSPFLNPRVPSTGQGTSWALLASPGQDFQTPKPVLLPVLSSDQHYLGACLHACVCILRFS